MLFKFWLIFLSLWLMLRVSSSGFRFNFYLTTSSICTGMHSCTLEEQCSYSISTFKTDPRSARLLYWGKISDLHGICENFTFCFAQNVYNSVMYTYIQRVQEQGILLVFINLCFVRLQWSLQGIILANTPSTHCVMLTGLLLDASLFF